MGDALGKTDNINILLKYWKP